MKYLIYGSFLIFLGLKLAGIGIVASWSWWAVCSPLLVQVFLIVIAFLYHIGEAKEKAKRDWRLSSYQPTEKKSKFMQRMEEAIKRSEEKGR